MKTKGSKNKLISKFCVVCCSNFLATRKNNVMCSAACRNKRFNGTYSGKCKDCGAKTHYFTNIRCKPCDAKRRTLFAESNFKKRFFAKVKKTPTCWIWTASRTDYGYGYFGFKGVCYLAHRVSCEMAHGKIPDGWQALHKCDNPPCVNPDHLYIGTPLDNALDRANKERWNVNAKSNKAIRC